MSVKIWEQPIVIPTYEVGKPEKNPMFIEKRVYQGSSGKVYPYPTIEEISDVRVDKIYQAVYLENEYLQIMVLPELGGRIQRAYDKTNDYDFVYYNHVIKPALVGLVGPWISGGIEFNWPQHHRPATYLPVDYQLCENPDGSCSVLIHDVDRMYGTQVLAKFTLYPGKAYIEITGQLYNRTSTPQTFLWWANPAVPVNDHTQSIFPPDVTAVMDHGKRDVSRFPIATGTYYKMDYSEGVDISRYKNIPVPTSYMAAKSEYNFVGGYDYGRQAGILHVADHHISPGKKQWTWGCGDFGQAWDRNLTDSDGPYVELMTGVYTDNQPDFTWLKPFEEKTFTQYFMPYKAVGEVKNASIEAAVTMKKTDKGVYICTYATGVYEQAEIRLKAKGKTAFSQTVKLSPVDTFEATVPVDDCREEELEVSVLDRGRVLVAYQPKPKKLEKRPEPAVEAKNPQEIMSLEELYLTGLHLEQYRHATYRPDDYYLEGLKRDPKDSRINVAYGSLLMRRGLYGEAEKHFRNAIARLTYRNPNPYNSEAYYYLGLVLLRTGRMDEAFDAFYKATWTNEQQEMSFFFMAAIETNRGELGSALYFIEKALVKNGHNIKARALKLYILRKLGREEDAKAFRVENLVLDPFDYQSVYEGIYLAPADAEQICTELVAQLRGDAHALLRLAQDYAQFGEYSISLDILKLCEAEDPLLKYFEGLYLSKLGDEAGARAAVISAEKADPYCCFPNTLEDKEALEYALSINPDGGKAHYYLGNLNYDKSQHHTAFQLWKRAAELDAKFPTVWRNLALAAYNNEHDPTLAKEAMERAFQLDSDDARVLMELDQLYAKLGYTAEDRLANLNRYPETLAKRDDLFIEYIKLHNLLGMHREALELTMGRKFHPWEGGEGKITSQYTIALLELGKAELAHGNAEGAIAYFERVLTYPENLGEGRLAGTKDNHVHYYMGLAYEQLGDNAKAAECFALATLGDQEPAGMMFYNDQPADMILYQGLACRKLGRIGEANARFYKLLDYGEQHMDDEMRIGYFAVSLPDFLIFEDDLNKRNRVHCHFLLALARIGMGQMEEAEAELSKALAEDPIHQTVGLLANQLKAETRGMLHG